jgi:hypothetical protein
MMSKGASVAWGFIAVCMGSLLSVVIPIPFFGIIFEILLYLFFLKPREIMSGYYVLGILLPLIIIIVLAGSIIGSWWIFG